MRLIQFAPYVFTTTRTICLMTSLRPVRPVSNKWFTLGVDGTMLIVPGYSWDGCSPKVRLLEWLTFGTPDGPIARDGLPAMYYPTLFHDVCYQFKKELAAAGVTRKSIDEGMVEIAATEGVKPWVRWIYDKFVRTFGWLWWLGVKQ